MPALVHIALTARQAELIKRLLNQTILDTGSNKTARDCEAILTKFAQSDSAACVAATKGAQQ